MGYSFLLIAVVMLSCQDKALLVNLYYTNLESTTAALRKVWWMKSVKHGKRPISAFGLLRIVWRFEATDSVKDMPRSGRPSTSSTVAAIVEEHIDSEVESSPHATASARDVSHVSDIIVTTVWKAFQMTWLRYPYKIQNVQQLLPQDGSKHEFFAQWAFSKMENDDAW